MCVPLPESRNTHHRFQYLTLISNFGMQLKKKTKKEILETDGNNFHIFIINSILYIKVNS